MTGYFGKVPMYGDFVRHGLPQAFVSAWENWATQLLMQDQERIKNNWQKCPVYRFLLTRSIAGQNGWAGIFVASSDKIGRRFPFCIASPIHFDVNPIKDLAIYESWFQEIHLLSNQIQANTLDLDKVALRLDEIDILLPDVKQSQDIEATQLITLEYEVSYILTVTDENFRSSQNISNLTMPFDPSTFACSAWITSDSPYNEARLLIYNGFPGGDLGLLDGHFSTDVIPLYE